MKCLLKRRTLPLIVMLAIASFLVTPSFVSNTTKHGAVGLVYGANGPVAGAYVSAEAAVEGTNGSGFAVTDSLGQYTMTTGLTAGTYNVSAFAYGYITSEVDLVNVTAGQTTPGVDIDLQLSGAISGVISNGVTGLDGVLVYAILANGTGDFGFFGNTTQGGQYLISTNLPTGMYNVSILLAPDGYITQMTTANVTAGIETENVDMQLAASGIISGTVSAPNGTALYGISVSAFSSDYSHFGTATTDISGNYRIATGLETDNYTLIATGDGNTTIYGGFLNPIEVPVIAGQETSGINIELTPVTTPPSPSGTISGRVTDQSNNPIRFASVTATGSNGTGFGETDDNGYYNVSSGLGTGIDYNVSATASGYYTAYYPSLVSVTVEQTTPDINIQMIALPPETFGTITGTITGAPNPIIPEFPYPVMAILLLAIVTLAASKLILKTKRCGNKNYPA